MTSPKLRVFLMSLLLLSLAGMLFAGEKGGNTIDSEEELQILKRYEDFGQCITPREQEDAFQNLCERLSTDTEINYPMSHGVSADREFENKRKFFVNCCY